MQDNKKYELTFTEQLLGGVPMSKTIWEKYLKNHLSEDDEEDRLPEDCVVGSGLTGFYKDTQGVYLYDYHIKGFLKESGNTLKDIVKIKNLKSKLDNFLFIEPRAIWLADKVTGILERPLRGMTSMGPRVSIARSEYLDPPLTIQIGITLINHKELNFNVVETLLDYGTLKGIGQWRNASYGRFKWSAV